MRRISVIGFGKIGQAVAACILQQEITVVGVDTDPALLHLFGTNTFHTNEPRVQEILVDAFARKELIVTGAYAEVAGSDAVIIAIPLVIDSSKKLLSAPFLDAMRQLSPFLSNNTVVVVETSIPVGFSRESILPALEAGGRIHGSDFLLAHSPERIKSGTMLDQLNEIPKVLGGLSKQALQKAREVYSWFLKDELLHEVGSIESAEMVKLAGMIYRDVNIALSNQLAQFSQAAGIPFADLIPLINTDREAGLLQPGIGVGGHCTPVYPYFLIENFKKTGLEFTLARASRSINDGMAAFATSQVREKSINKKALILGLSFRPNVKEDSLSSTYLLNEELKRIGFDVVVDDVEFNADEVKERGLQPANDIYSSGADVIFLVTMHKEYQQLDFHKLYRSGIRLFVDGRNSVDRSKVTSSGIEYIGIGR